jgi:hypothetical protein
MVKVLFDSTIEIWGTNYINNPYTRAPEDLDKEIQQIEAIPGDVTNFIVEVFRPARLGGENEHTN